MQDPMAMADAVMALRGQAAAWLATTKQQLDASGRSFDADLRAAIAAEAAEHPLPPGYDAGDGPSPEDLAKAKDLAERVASAEFPPEGLTPDDPRLAPVDGITLPLLAIGAKAIGWSTDDDHIARVIGALGLERAAWDRASAELTARTQADPVLATFYGQLYAQA